MKLSIKLAAPLPAELASAIAAAKVGAHSSLRDIGALEKARGELLKLQEGMKEKLAKAHAASKGMSAKNFQARADIVSLTGQLEEMAAAIQNADGDIFSFLHKGRSALRNFQEAAYGLCIKANTLPSAREVLSAAVLPFFNDARSAERFIDSRVELSDSENAFNRIFGSLYAESEDATVVAHALRNIIIATDKLLSGEELVYWDSEQERKAVIMDRAYEGADDDSEESDLIMA